MSLATVLSRAQNGLTSDLVRVEVHLANGLPGLAKVALLLTHDEQYTTRTGAYGLLLHPVLIPETVAG